MSIELLRAKLAVPEQSKAIFGRGGMSEESYRRMTEQVALARGAVAKREAEERSAAVEAEFQALYAKKQEHSALRRKVEDTVEKYIDYGGDETPLEELEDLSWFGYFIRDYIPHPHTKENIIRWTLEALKEKEGGIREEQFVDKDYAKDKKEREDAEEIRRDQEIWDKAMKKYVHLSPEEQLKHVRHETTMLKRPAFRFDPDYESEEEEEDQPEIAPNTFQEERAAMKLGNKALTRADIRKQYRTLARLLHPDKNPKPEAKAAFQKMKAAYDRLMKALT